jgi:hypothetical protein
MSEDKKKFDWMAVVLLAICLPVLLVSIYQTTFLVLKVAGSESGYLPLISLTVGVGAFSFIGLKASVPYLVRYVWARWFG